MDGSPAETFQTLIGAWLAAGVVLGLTGYLSTLWGFATLLRLEPVTVRIPAYEGEAGEAQGEHRSGRGEAHTARVGRQNAGLVLLSAGLALILTACALEGYVFAVLVHLAAG